VTSRTVEALPGAGLVFLSGQTPEPAAPDAPRFSASYWGDTETQTPATLAKLDRQLKGLGLSMADVVKLLVAVRSAHQRAYPSRVCALGGYVPSMGAPAWISSST
jgi:enamine deaminase RidA (YjgF/YER057c/UK114 family)